MSTARKTPSLTPPRVQVSPHALDLLHHLLGLQAALSACQALPDRMDDIPPHERPLAHLVAGYARDHAGDVDRLLDDFRALGVRRVLR
ncbi:MAG: hypothetical protein D6775_03735 [Caldilineae bacterium]|nr:MAG: hypothetical protein D6775_03735 [Caldilineae bacterium]